MGEHGGVWLLAVCMVVCLGGAHGVLGPPGPTPTVFYTFQEPTGAPRVSSAGYPYHVTDNGTSAVQQVEGGVWGPYAAYFAAGARLMAPRAAVPALANIGGPNATVSVVAWAKFAEISGGAFLGGVWNEYLAARQFALFTSLGICSDLGVVAHISAVGGPTPGNRFCITAACGVTRIPLGEWLCLANVYDGVNIRAYFQGRLDNNGTSDATNPYYYPDGIFLPPAGATGSEFAIGANIVNVTVGGPPEIANTFIGTLGGLAIYSSALNATQLADICASPPLW